MVVYRRDVRRRPVLLIIIIASLVLVTIDSRGNGAIDAVRGAARDLIAPVQNVVDDAFSPVRDLWDGVTDYSAVKDENERLKRELAAAQGKLERERAVGSEVSELEKLLDLPTIEDATGVAARVVGGAPGNFERTVQLDKGTADGVRVGQPVVAGNGLVGKITEASGSGSTVTLIDSPGFGVGVRLEKSKEKGIAEGRTGERELRLTFLDNPLTKVDKGELVFTSAVSDSAFPPDVPVATVTSVERQQGDLEQTILLKPLVNLDDLTYLKVLRQPGTPGA